MKPSAVNDWIPIVACATLALLIGVVGGLWLAGLGTCEFREWLSALSGWAAAIAALTIGLVTLRPIARQAEIQNAEYNLKATEHLLDIKRSAEPWNPKIHSINAFISRAQKGSIFAPEDTDEIPKGFPINIQPKKI